MNTKVIILAVSSILAEVVAGSSSLDWIWNGGVGSAGNNVGLNNGINSNNNNGFNSNNGYNNNHSWLTPSQSFGFLPHLCQVVRKTHPVQYVSYSDSTGRWALYTQIMETRNVGNRCNVNELVLLSHRQPSGWFWNPKIESLLHYALDEPRFVTRKVRDPFNVQREVNVNLSRASQAPNTSLNSGFSEYIAGLVLRAGKNDAKWLETARQLSSQMKQDTLYFQYVKHHPNAMAVPLVPLPRPGTREALLQNTPE